MNQPGQPFSDDIVDAFADVLRPRLGPGESLDAVLRGGFELAERRAALLNRPVTPLDAEFAFSLLCHWPFKPPATDTYRAAVAPIRAQVLAERPDFFTDLQLDDESALSRLVPDATLTLTHEQLYDAMANAEVERLFRDGPGLLTAREPATTTH